MVMHCLSLTWPCPFSCSEWDRRLVRGALARPMPATSICEDAREGVALPALPVIGYPDPVGRQLREARWQTLCMRPGVPAAGPGGADRRTRGWLGWLVCRLSGPSGRLETGIVARYPTEPHFLRIVKPEHAGAVEPNEPARLPGMEYRAPHADDEAIVHSTLRT